MSGRPRSSARRPKPLILLTNDDGYFSPALAALATRLRPSFDVRVVAPDRERSANSLSLTLRRPLRLFRVRTAVFAVDGTPADCIYLALKSLLPRRPDLILSGMNLGPNLGEQDIAYSGTVAAAIQGTFLGIPSVAVSLIPDAAGNFELGASSAFVVEVAGHLLAKRLPPGITLNINIPSPPVRGVRITGLGQKKYQPEVIEKKDPRGRLYYWIGTSDPEGSGDARSDIRAVAEGFISITPLHTDMTDYRMMRHPGLTGLRSCFHERRGIRGRENNAAGPGRRTSELGRDGGGGAARPPRAPSK
jgi:5'-nucleotidase